MTCRYSTLNQHDVLYNAVRNAPGGVEAMAQRLTTSADVLYKKLRRQVSTHHTTLEEFSRMLEVLEEHGVADWSAALRAVCWRHGHVAVPLPVDDENSDEELVALVCDAFKEHGDVAEGISRALGDKRVTEREAEEIEHEIEQAVAALMLVKQRVRQKANLE